MHKPPSGSSILSLPIVTLFSFFDTGGVERINPTGSYAYVVTLPQILYLYLFLFIC